MGMEIEELIAEADQCLREADPLCSDANAYYAETRLLIEQSTILWARILFLHTAQQDQLQNIGNVCLVIKNAVDMSKRECQHKFKALSRSRAELRGLLTTLKATPLDAAFEGGTLFQFVHEDDVNALDAKVDELGEQLQRQLVEVEKLPADVQAQLADLRTQSPKIQEKIMQTEIPKKLSRISSRSAPFASRMADLLVSLTSHYDLCRQIPGFTPEEAQEATQVALGDRDQVLKAIEHLKDARSQLKARHRESQRMQDSLAVIFEQCRMFESELARFVEQTLRPALDLVEHAHSACRVCFNDTDAVTNELTSLTEYYRLFKKSYHALVVEIARRHESAKQLTKVVENANNVLAGLHKRESETRAAFVQTYQDFLPPELWTGLADMPKEYSIELGSEQLPELSKSTLVAALKEQ